MYKEHKDLEILYALYDNATSKAEQKHYLNKILEINPNDIDSMHRLIDLLPANKQLDELLKLKDKCFDLVSKTFDEYEDLYCNHETRPYMFILFDILARYEKSKNIEEAYPLMLEMIKLNPGDNLGIRFHLAAYYIGQNKLMELKELINKYKDDFSVALKFSSLYLKELEKPTKHFKTLFDELPYLYALISKELYLNNYEIESINNNIEYYSPLSFYECLIFFRLLNIYSTKEIKHNIFKLCAHYKDMPKISIKSVLPSITKDVIYSMYMSFKNEEKTLINNLEQRGINKNIFDNYKDKLTKLDIIIFRERNNTKYFYFSEATTTLAKMYINKDIEDIEYLKGLIY